MAIKKVSRYKIIKSVFDFFLSFDHEASNHKIIKDVNDFCYKMLNVKYTGLYIDDEGRNEVISLKQDITRMEFNSELTDKIKRDNRIYGGEISKDFTLIPQFEAENRLKYLLVIPLTNKNKHFGFLFFYGTDPQTFNDFSVKVLKLLTKVLSLTIGEKKLYREMEQRVAELITLQNVSNFVNATLDFEKLLDVSLDALVGLIGLRTCSIVLFTDKLFDDIYTRKQNTLIASLDMSKEIVLDLSSGIYKELSRKKKVIAGKVSFDDDLSKIIPLDNIEEGKEIEYIIVPVTRGKELIGSINIFSMDKGHLPILQHSFLESFANQFSVALQNALLYKKQEEMANRDGLTGLYNHAYFQNRLHLLLKQENKHPLTLIIMDIDNFKQVNDRFGHLVGDKVLKELAHLLKHNLREGDLIARYGGEEFAIILPETELKQGEFIAKRLRKLISDNEIVLDNNRSLYITVSIGVAQYNKKWSQEEFIDKADQALYKAKEAGKNRVTLA
ncbi:sensor domain-containing diguanylate cyclase [Halothermothrix orenii]|uniref:Diguanylate cyclase n=1 Tax=Halothermothrix orenii (strain H 168 / OCM 544 / DSM 9562) TaxID=373903 RepID=B8CXG9_HALOH|nr:sensor domain-containing diguanylate cyclase [Halothermothrix orenii]ACL69988.1 diguanylate cyclase [Halothermothrix orenii H 168]